ncbi:MAG: hypothetical protein U1C96_11195 [Gallionella sp.]|nr:hypothetical protein [Gallionella sp.]
MNSVHLLVPDLLLPQEFAAEVCAGLHLPALEKILARGRRLPAQAVPLESRFGQLFGLPVDAGFAAFSAAFDGLGEGVWLRADPVHLSLRHEQLLLLPDVVLGADEASEFCTGLNRHFSDMGLRFTAPHPQRWYLRLDTVPQLRTVPLSQAAWRDVRGLLPGGADAARWMQLFNEIQMLLFSHPLNAQREARDELAVNSLWLWGSGRTDAVPQRSYRGVSSDETLAAMLAAASATSFRDWTAQWQPLESGEQLLVWGGLRSALQRGDLAEWRDAVQAFETGYAQPLWQALRSGKLQRLRLESAGGATALQLELGRADTWRFWRPGRSLATCAMV